MKKSPLSAVLERGRQASWLSQRFCALGQVRLCATIRRLDLVFLGDKHGTRYRRRLPGER